MSVLDMPNVPPQYAPVIIAQASQVQQGNVNAERTIGICHLAENPADPPMSAVNSMSPLVAVWSYLQKYEGRTVDIRDDMKTLKISVLQAPAHGTLKDEGSGDYRYLPVDSYFGVDRATLLVEIGGQKIKVIYFFNVLHHVPGGTDNYDPLQDKGYCPNGYRWKISSTLGSNGTNMITAVEYQSPTTSATDTTVGKIDGVRLD